ncbi:MAG: ABC transporter ATP-binding protein [Bacteroidales bacterium]|nr:ABC transporter ATP-binding protein [Bacteroidales bacterium]MBN2757801.1 ABC transporter ATP-binding protein [Bacteroidales bacterium]
MPETVIKLENIGKQYRLGTVGSQTLRGDLQRWWYNLRGKDDPFLKIGQSNQLNQKSIIKNHNSNYVWALNDINLEVKQGQILGIIGKNGAGKSTLLKLLSRVTTPTTGNIKVKGRIASLLEVGTGFHPELTGRENIFLNGAILGMTKAEIRSKFDEIVDFSGVEKYIDTPVKRYSSGMYVRLAFAVAAHLEPDILVVDEVLAVGDAEFQKKAIGKMQDVSSGQGRTVLFVSHNMASVKMLCSKGILLQEGNIIFDGNIIDTINSYVSKKENISGSIDFSVKVEGIRKYYSGEARISSIRLHNDKSETVNTLQSGEKIIIKIGFIVYNEISNVFFDLKINSKEGIPVIYSASLFNYGGNFNKEKGEHSILIETENNLLPDLYSLTVGIHYIDGRTVDMVNAVMQFEVISISKIKSMDYPYKWKYGYIRQNSVWEIN